MAKQRKHAGPIVGEDADKVAENFLTVASTAERLAEGIRRFRRAYLPQKRRLNSAAGLALGAFGRAFADLDRIVNPREAPTIKGPFNMPAELAEASMSIHETHRHLKALLGAERWTVDRFPVPAGYHILATDDPNATARSGIWVCRYPERLEDSDAERLVAQAGVIRRLLTSKLAPPAGGDSANRADGIYPPSIVRLQGKDCETLSPLELRIVQYMMDKDSAPKREALKEIWKHTPSSDEAVRTRLNEANKKLKADGIRVRFGLLKGYLVKKQY